MRSTNKLFFIISLAIVGAVFIEPAPVNAAGSILISEVMYDLAGSDTNREWVEIYNAGSDPVTIVDGIGDGSWRFNDGSNHVLKLVQGSLTLPASGVAVLVSTSTVFLADHPGFSGTLIDTTMSLNNTSDTLKLSADKGATFFSEIIYQNTWGANGDGKSLEKIDLNGNNEQSNWRASVTDGGTPGLVSSSGSSSSTSSSTSTPDQSSPSTQTSNISSGGGGSGISISSSTPSLELTAEAGADVVAEVGQVVKFDGSVSQGATGYKWYLGDGTVENNIITNHAYKFPGTYLVTLEVSNGTEIALDQAKVNIFGGKAIINEFFAGSIGSGGWIEIFNPTNADLDLSNWILSLDSKSFVLPLFTIVTRGGFLVLSQETTGLDTAQAKSVKLKYPNGTIVDEVVLEKNMPNYSASRNNNGFFWSKEPTPGRPNIVLSSGLSENINVTPKKVSANPESSKSSVYLASFYSQVSDLPGSIDNSLNSSVGISAQVGFWDKILGKFYFWVILSAVLGVFISLFYIKLSHKK